MGLFNKKLAIDLGTTQTRVVGPKKGLIIDEPSVMAKDKETDEIIAIGNEALEMIGRTPDKYVAYRPLSRGVIADYKSTVKMLKYFVRKASGLVHITQPEAMITVFSGATSTERRALVDAGQDAGLKNVYLIPTGLASALGAGVSIIEPRGTMIINIGGSSTEITILSLGGVVSENSVRFGTQDINQAIIKSVKYNFALNIGESTAEEVKRLVGSLSNKSDRIINISGQGVSDGLPHTTQIHSDDIRGNIEGVLERIVLAAKLTLEKTPPDLIADIVDSGIFLTGGGAYLHGIEEYLSNKLKAKVQVAQDPLLCSVKGANIALSHLADYKKSLVG